MANDDVELYDMVFQTETENAICVREVDGDVDIWLPKSQIDYDDEGLERGDELEVEIPDWLAEERIYNAPH